MSFWRTVGIWWVFLNVTKLMSTRSNIGIVYGDGSVKAIYCHFDGYPAYVGRILLEHYNVVERIEELIDGGDLSSIGEKISTDIPHSFNYPVEGVCVYYKRDHGEKNVDAYLYRTIRDYENVDNGCDYQYLFTDGKWQYHKYNGVWGDLTPEVCKMY